MERHHHIDEPHVKARASQTAAAASQNSIMTLTAQVSDGNGSSFYYTESLESVH